MKRNNLAVILFAGAMLAAPAVRADATFAVSLDTSSISGTDGQVVFELIDGDGVVDNSISLSSFDLGGGTVGAPADYMGSSGVTGDLTGTIAMDDSGGVALFTQLVTFGSSLVLHLSTTNGFSGFGAPDALSMALYASDFGACFSNDQVACTLLQLNLDGGTLAPASFTLNGASVQGLPAPVVTFASAPEPGSLLLLAAALLAFVSSKSIGRRPRW